MLYLVYQVVFEDDMLSDKLNTVVLLTKVLLHPGMKSVHLFFGNEASPPWEINKQGRVTFVQRNGLQSIDISGYWSSLIYPAFVISCFHHPMFAIPFRRKSRDFILNT